MSLKIIRVPESIDFPKEEEKILKFWKDIDAFQSCLKQSKNKPRYSFYDGPPFATGLPHYGHILAGTIKDVVTRYAHQKGYHVERRFGWDCHGLPVEFEIDKTLGVKGPEDVEKMGIDKYNAECRKIVMKYATEWETIITRMGRWIDFKNDYKTLYPWFMESIWWVFKELYNKGLVYQGVKVMPYSTACSTPLSNFESELMYKTLRQLLPGDSLESVHFNMIPEPKQNLVDTNIERAVQRMQTVIELGRVLRDRKTIPIKYPLPEMIVIHRDETYLNDVNSLLTYVLEEMNVKKIQLTSDKEKYGITLRVEPDHKILGVRLKGDFKAVTQALKNLNNEQCEKLIADGYVELVGQRIDVSEVRFIFQATGNEQYEAHSDNDVLILLNVTPDQDMLDEGFAREIINRVQKLRKKAHLVPTDEVDVFFSTSKTGDILRIINLYRELIETTVKAPLKLAESLSPSKPIIIQEVQELKGAELKLIITWRKDVELPASPWANVILQKLTPRFGATANHGNIILSDKDKNLLTVESLYKEITVLFGLYGIKFTLWCDGAEVKNVDNLNGKTIIVSPTVPEVFENRTNPFCKFINFINGSKTATLFLENPQGTLLWNKEKASKFASNHFGIQV
ncbi:unnamed protein product, partial [Iphiclides podalirius]